MASGKLNNNLSPVTQPASDVPGGQRPEVILAFADGTTAFDAAGNLKVARRYIPAAGAVYRSAVTAADVLAPPGTVTTSKQAGGGATAGVYNVKVVAVITGATNGAGRTTATAGSGTVTTETTNLTVRAAFAQVVGATHYDIYCSTDTDPKWVGRITEAQRVSGIKLTAVNTTGAGGTAGAVDVEVPGTGLQAALVAAVNTAYVIPANPIDCTGFECCDLDLGFARTGDAVELSAILIPFLRNSDDSAYYACQEFYPSFGGRAGVYGSVRQSLRVDVRGRSALALVFAQLAGTGVSADVRYTLS